LMRAASKFILPALMIRIVSGVCVLFARADKTTGSAQPTGP